MKIIKLLFVYAILISNLLPEIRTTQSAIPNGCVASGLTHCCTLDTCVTLGGCYCDQGCYDTSDCCDDIHQTCPPSAGDGISDGGSGESPTLDPNSNRPPRITIPEDNVTVPTALPHRLTMLVDYDKGYPLSTLVWRKDGEIITSRRNPRVSVMSNGGITIRSVKSSDRGLYTITVSNAVGSDSASFKLFTKFANLVESEFREGSFFCEAKGYPIAHFVGWTAMNGSGITNDEWTSVHSGMSEFESTMIASLPLNAVNCTAAGGISCVFDNGNGSYRVESPMMDCPTVVDVRFEESEYSINERAANNQYVALRVCLRQTDTDLIPDTDTFTVTIATQGGTAIAGSDFVAMSVDRTFTLPLQQFEVCECISIIQDDVTEGDEVFYLTLTSTHPQIKTTGAIVHIIDDDAVIASLEKTEYFVSESEGCVEVCVLLVGRYQSSVTVHLCIEGINATANEDYIGHDMAIPLTFQTSALVSPEMRGRACASLMLINDDVVEGNETIRVQIQPDYDDISVKIADQSSAIVTIIDDDTVPITATMINDTPRVEASMVTINFQLDGGSPAQRAALRCRITGPGRTPPVVIENCNSGVVVEELTFRKQEFNFTLEDTVGGSGGESVVLLQRDFRLDSDVCWLHLINQGVYVNGTSAIFEWRPSGPFVNYKSSSFRCLKDLIRTKENCSSPYTWTDLSPGRHRLIVEPYQTPGCRRLQNRVIYFTV